MDLTKPMKLLMLEDEEFECNRFKNYINTRIDVKLIATTNSCNEALDYIKSHFIEGVIVDIELHDGSGGSGLNFLADLNSLNLDMKPLVIITTNNLSKRTHNTARKLGVDLIFCKTQKDYSPETVINSFIMLRSSLYCDTPISIVNKTNLETKEDCEKRIVSRINIELDNIGIPHHLTGRQYIFDALYYLLQTKDNNPSYLYFLAAKYKKGNSSVSNAIQVCINNAWNTTPYDELEKLYTARVSYKNGVPTPVEFIYYYVEKIKKLIN